MDFSENAENYNYRRRSSILRTRPNHNRTENNIEESRSQKRVSFSDEIRQCVYNSAATLRDPNMPLATPSEQPMLSKPNGANPVTWFKPNFDVQMSLFEKHNHPPSSPELYRALSQHGQPLEPLSDNVKEMTFSHTVYFNNDDDEANMECSSNFNALPETSFYFKSGNNDMSISVTEDLTADVNQALADKENAPHQNTSVVMAESAFNQHGAKETKKSKSYINTPYADSEAPLEMAAIKGVRASLSVSIDEIQLPSEEKQNSEHASELPVVEDLQLDKTELQLVPQTENVEVKATEREKEFTKFDLKLTNVTADFENEKMPVKIIETESQNAKELYTANMEVMETAESVGEPQNVNMELTSVDMEITNVEMEPIHIEVCSQHIEMVLENSMKIHHVELQTKETEGELESVDMGDEIAEEAKKVFEEIAELGLKSDNATVNINLCDPVPVSAASNTETVAEEKYENLMDISLPETSLESFTIIQRTNSKEIRVAGVTFNVDKGMDIVNELDIQDRRKTFTVVNQKEPEDEAKKIRKADEILRVNRRLTFIKSEVKKLADESFVAKSNKYEEKPETIHENQEMPQTTEHHEKPKITEQQEIQEMTEQQEIQEMTEQQEIQEMTEQQEIPKIVQKNEEVQAIEQQEMPESIERRQIPQVSGMHKVVTKQPEKKASSNLFKKPSHLISEEVVPIKRTKLDNPTTPVITAIPTKVVVPTKIPVSQSHEQRCRNLLSNTESGMRNSKVRNRLRAKTRDSQISLSTPSSTINSTASSGFDMTTQIFIEKLDTVCEVPDAEVKQQGAANNDADREPITKMVHEECEMVLPLVKEMEVALKVNVDEESRQPFKNEIVHQPLDVPKALHQEVEPVAVMPNVRESIKMNNSHQPIEVVKMKSDRSAKMDAKKKMAAKKKIALEENNLTSVVKCADTNRKRLSPSSENGISDSSTEAKMARVLMLKEKAFGPEPQKSEQVEKEEFLKKLEVRLEEKEKRLEEMVTMKTENAKMMKALDEMYQKADQCIMELKSDLDKQEMKFLKMFIISSNNEKLKQFTIKEWSHKKILLSAWESFLTIEAEIGEQLPKPESGPWNQLENRAVLSLKKIFSSQSANENEMLKSAQHMLWIVVEGMNHLFDACKTIHDLLEVLSLLGDYVIRAKSLCKDLEWAKTNHNVVVNGDRVVVEFIDEVTPSRFSLSIDISLSNYSSHGCRVVRNDAMKPVMVSGEVNEAGVLRRTDLVCKGLCYMRFVVAKVDDWLYIKTWKK